MVVGQVRAGVRRLDRPRRVAVGVVVDAKKYGVGALWLLQNTPTLFPPKAMIDEMSSVLTLAAAGNTNGVPHAVSEPVVRLSQIHPARLPRRPQLPGRVLGDDQRLAADELMSDGKPASSE